MSKKEIQIVVMLELVAPEHKEKAIIKDKSERDEVFKLYKEVSILFGSSNVTMVTSLSFASSLAMTAVTL